MDKNVCSICGSNYVPKDGRWVCPFCGAYKPEEINNEEQTLIYQAEEQIRLGNFDDAEEIFSHAIELFPNNSQGYWGRLRAHYGIKYEKDYNQKAVPTCYNTSYESFFENPDYAKALEKADPDTKAYYQREAWRIEELRKEWIEKAEAEEPYDVFLSYKDTEFGSDGVKTDDYHKVYEIYNHLTSLGYRVFFARKSLSGKTGERNYEPYIFRALNTAPVMIVYASNPEYVKATWVKNEWTRFLKRIERGEKADNALAVAFSGFNASLLPKPLDSIQNFDASSLTFVKELERYVEEIVTKAKMTLPKISRISIAPKQGILGKVLGKVKLRKAGGITAAPKAKPKAASIESREFGLAKTPSLTGDTENKLLAAEEYIKQNRFEDAQGILNGILDKDKRNGRALYLKMLANARSNDLESFISKIDSFEDFNLLNSVIGYGERSFSERILSLLASAVQRLFESEKYDVSLRFYRQIASYDAEAIRSLHRTVFDSVLGQFRALKGGVISPILCEHLDLALLYIRADEAHYKKALEKTILTAHSAKRHKEAMKYLDEYKDAFGINGFYLLEAFVAESKAETFEDALENADGGSRGRLSNGLDSVSESDADTLLSRIAEGTLDFIRDGRYSAAIPWVRFLEPYDFPGRGAFVEKAKSTLVAHASPDNYEIFKAVLSFYDKGQENTFYTAYEEYADELRLKGSFQTAKEAYDALIEYVPDSERILFHKVLAMSRCQEVKSLASCIGNLSGESDFGPVESYLSVEPSEQGFASRLFKLSDAAKEGFIGYGKRSALDVFERLSAYFPKSEDEKLASDFFALAEACKQRGLFDLASRYYSLYISLHGSNPAAYWGLLQCKLRCKNDDELIRSSTPIGTLPEFNNAIAAAGGDQKLVAHYIECRVRQDARIAKRGKHSFIRKRAAIWGGIAGLIGAIVLTFSLLTANVFIPNSRYEEGISLINEGKYEDALKTLEGLGYSDSDAQVLVAKAGVAFEQGDYETGISKIYDAGGTVDISYDANGGTTNKHGKKEQTLRKSSYVTATATKPGYTFVEWKQESFSLSTSKEHYSAEVALKASYEIVTYHISYDLGGGTLENPIREYTILANDFVIGTPTKRGYTFAGWSGSGLSGEQMTVTIRSGSVGDRNFIANWTANEYQINYDYGYGGKTDTKKVTYDDDYQLETPERDGYDFDGWYDGDEEIEDGVWQSDSDKTFTAHWSAKQYSIAYDLDGGTNHVSNPSSYTIESPDINLFAPTKKGYEFLGWTKEGVSAPTKEIEVPSGSLGDITFTAHWEPREYKLSLDYRGGSFDYEEDKITFDSEFTLPNDSEKAGYTFAGWFDVKTGEQVLASTWTWDHDLSVYAKWDLESYKISYLLNGGTNSIDNPATYTAEDEDITIVDADRPGYTFKGWDDGSGEPRYSPVIPSGSTENRQYEAVWSANLNTIIFHANGATSGEMDSTEGYTDTKINLPTTLYQKEGYHFAGWSLSPTGAVAYSDGAEMLVGTASLVNLYAHWEPNLNTVTFHANGGTGTMNNQQMGTDQTGPLNANSYQKEGYHLVGWATEQDGEPVYNDGAQYTMGSNPNYDLYAKWAPNTYALTLDANGGSSSSQSSVTYDSAYSIPVPSRAGYYFAGWYHGDDQLTDVNGDSLQNFVIPSDITVTAHWTPKLNVVILTDEQNFVQIQGYSDSYVRLPANPFVPEDGYLFDGWAISAGGDLAFQDKDLFYVGTNSSYTLHAIFGDYSDYKWISTKNDLKSIGTAQTGKKILLTNDIDLDGEGIGQDGISDSYVNNGGSDCWGRAFRGLFDGRGHSIRNFVIDSFKSYDATTILSTAWYFCMGLFPRNLGTIKNLNVYDFEIDFSKMTYNGTAGNMQDVKVFAGGLVGHNLGLISNCFVKMSGSIGHSAKRVDYCYVGVVSAWNSGGGVCADCTAFADVAFDLDGRNTYFGAFGYYGTISRCASHAIIRNYVRESAGRLNRRDFATWLCERDGVVSADGSNEVSIEKERRWIKYNINGSLYYSYRVSREQKDPLIPNVDKEGYTLIGWALSEDGPMVYGLEEEVGLDEHQDTLTLYAVWQKNLNTIVFHGNGSTSGQMEDAMGYTDDLLVLPACSFVKEGYHFAGWARNAESLAVFGDAETIVMPSDATLDLYAVWEPNENQIVFHANGGGGSMENQIGFSDSSFSLNSCTFEAPDGCYFAGWAFAPDGESAYPDCGTFTMTTEPEYNLYAIWKPIS